MNNQETIIVNNFAKERGSFLYELTENNFFSEEKFFELLYSISIFSRDIDVENRMKWGLRIWDISFEILSLITYSMNPNDAFTIVNIDKYSVGKIVRRLYEVSTSFYHAKEVDLSKLVDIHNEG